MAKKKADKTSKSKTVAQPDVESPKVQTNGASKKSSSNGAPKKSSSPRRTFDNSEIGLVAGEVWQTLEGRGEQTLTSVKKSVEAPGDLVTAAVGWLARENKLRFVQSGRTTKVTLQ
ncbi:winged helix-turn-helix domain-containing protein [Stieleria sp. ICT_E10.1]|uniref:winged helix-turn-helix domain-containing protein n=1 Tax=Stieleria sedimenti TaxID=2976331 RepID=UPI0021800A78|nr:winged helix-turn-helix domain-containing protein [Stieleria sedimenti]MCS7465958.1 winged helix-turn-helix domain-containing protein [Stieleria sedimenti]